MDVKKYMGYLPLCMLSIIIVFSLLVRNIKALAIQMLSGI